MTGGGRQNGIFAPSHANSPPLSAGLSVSSTPSSAAAENAGVNRFSAATPRWNGAESAVSTVPGWSVTAMAKVPDQHVEGGLARTVGVPAAKPVVGNGADPRGKCGKNRPSVAPQQRQCVPGDQGRADRVDGKQLRHPIRAERAPGFFRPRPVRTGEAASSDQHDVERPANGGTGASHCGLVLQVECERPQLSAARSIAAPRSGVDFGHVVAGRQRCGERAAHAAGCTEYGAAQGGESRTHGYGLAFRAAGVEQTLKAGHQGRPFRQGADPCCIISPIQLANRLSARHIAISGARRGNETHSHGQ